MSCWPTVMSGLKPSWADGGTRGTHRGDGVDHAVGDLVLAHVLDHVELSGPLLGDDLVGDLLQLRVELFEEVLKEQRQELVRERETERG